MRRREQMVVYADFSARAIVAKQACGNMICGVLEEGQLFAFLYLVNPHPVAEVSRPFR